MIMNDELLKMLPMSEIEASNTFPDSDATRLEIRIGVGRGDIGIDENQVWVRYHFDLT